MLGEGAFAAIGECMVEVAPAGDGLHRLGFAGDTFNTAWAVRCLLPESRAVRFVTAVGRDWASDGMLAFMEEAGIDTGAVVRDEERTVGLYAIRLDADGERTFSYWRRNSAATGLADDPERLAAALGRASCIFFSGITLAILPEAGRARLIAALRQAREAGAVIAFDPNYRPRLWRDADAARAAIREALDVCDIALPTFGDEADLWGDSSAEETARRLLSCGVGEAVVKDGAEPALIVADGRRIRVAALGGVVPVDSTGAGDAFNGGYLAARMGGMEPEAAAVRAHRLAALAIGTRGALVPREAVRAI